MKSNKGFTLIELLVVIAIIGILASVVLVSLQSARKKGNDSRVISDVQQLRTLAESIYDGSTYDAGLEANNAVANGSGIDASGVGLQLYTDANTNGGVLFAKVDSSEKYYAIYGQLPSTNAVVANSKYFCIGSDGSTQQSTASIAANTTTGTNDLTASPICKP